jgi:hypothetical protein
MRDPSVTEKNLLSQPIMGGYLPSLLTVFGATLVYFLVFEALLDPLNPVAGPTDFAGSFLWEGSDPAAPATILASDLTARYTFGVPSVLMILSFIAALIVGFGFVLPMFGRLGVVCGGVAVIAGAIIGCREQFANPLRNVVADCTSAVLAAPCPLNQAVLRGAPNGSFDAEVFSHLRFLVSFNSMASVAAISLIGVCAMFIARSAPSSQLQPEYLVQRRIGLERMLVIVGPLLVLSVATTHGFYSFASALMEPSAANTYRLLGSAGTTYWGAIYSTVLVVIILPALASVAQDGRRASAKALPNGNFLDRLEWRKREGVELTVRDKLSVALTSFAPVLTTPVLDIVRKSLAV